MIRVESTGRVHLLLYGIVLTAVGTLLLSLSSAANRNGNIGSPALYVVGCSLVIGGYGVGFGPIPWILSAETFPTVIRGRVMSISLITSNAAQFVMNMIFLLMIDYLSTAWTFGFFFAMTLVSLQFVRWFCVETRLLSPPDILSVALHRRKVVSTQWNVHPMRCMLQVLFCGFKDKLCLSDSSTILATAEWGSDNSKISPRVRNKLGDDKSEYQQVERNSGPQMPCDDRDYVINSPFDIHPHAQMTVEPSVSSISGSHNETTQVLSPITSNIQ